MQPDLQPATVGSGVSTVPSMSDEIGGRRAAERAEDGPRCPRGRSLCDVAASVLLYYPEASRVCPRRIVDEATVDGLL